MSVIYWIRKRPDWKEATAHYPLVIIRSLSLLLSTNFKITVIMVLSYVCHFLVLPAVNNLSLNGERTTRR